MLPPEDDWKTLPQGPLQPPPNIRDLLAPSEEPCSVDVELLKIALLSYKGGMLERQLDGKGRGKYRVGYTYEGEYRNCLGNGEGVFCWTDGLQYRGETRHHVITGKGTYTYANGDTYCGEVEEGIRHGKGTYTRKSTGEQYTGDWESGLKHGRGVMHYANGGKYEGDWTDGERCGTGVMVYPSGNRYDGEWANNKRHGQGSMVWLYPDTRKRKQKYEGGWKEGEMDGKGTHWYYPQQPQDVQQQQHFPKEAVPVPPTALNYYTGGFRRGKRHGRGTFCYQDGGRYEGPWTDNIKEGEGMYLSETGAAYTGQFKGDRPIQAMNPGGAGAEVRRIPLGVDDLLLGEADREKVLHRVQTLLSRHYGTLRRLYQFYSSLNAGQESGDFTSSLSMLQFWRLLKDTGLIGSDTSLAAVDRIFLKFKPGAGTAAMAPPQQLDPLPIRRPASDLTIGFDDGDERSTRSGYATPLERRRSKMSAPGDGRSTGRRSSIKKSSQGHKAKGARTQGGYAVIRDIHSSSSQMFFREFVEAVVRVANLRYRSFPELTLADKLALLLQNDLKPAAPESLFLKESSQVSSVLTRHSDLLKRVYRAYSSRSYKGLDPHRSRPTNDVVITVRQFLTILKDVELVGSRKLPMRQVLSLFDVPLVPTTPPQLQQGDVSQGLTVFPPRASKHKRGSSFRDTSPIDPNTLTTRSYADSEDADRLSMRSRSPNSASRAGDGDEQSRCPSVAAAEQDRLNQLEERRQARRQQMDKLARGPEDFNVHCSMTAEQELLFEEFGEALVKVASLLRCNASDTTADCLDKLITSHLTKTLL